MDLFDYMKEQTLENESPLAPPYAPPDIGRGGRTGTYYRKG